jgi:uncharacterized membrane protein YwzB
MGKYIYSWGASGLWEIVRPIGLPLLIGGLWKIGFDYVMSAELLAVLFSAATMILTYVIASKMFNKRIAFLAALIMVVTPSYFLYSNYILTGIPSTFFVLLSVYFFIKNKIYASAFCASIASYFRLPQGLILVVLIATYFINNQIKKTAFIENLKKQLRILAIFVAVQIPYLILNFILYNADTTKLYHAFFRPWIMGLWAQSNPAEAYSAGSSLMTFLGNVFYYVYFPIFGTEHLYGNILLLLAFLAVGIFFVKKLWKKRVFNILFLSFFIYITYFTLISNKQMRFLNVFLPFYAILAAYGFFFVFDKIRWKHSTLLGFFIVFLIAYPIVDDNDKFYSWRAVEKPSVFSEYYEFFKDRSGPVITSDPILAVYSDERFIPIYFSVITAKELYDKSKKDARFVVYSDDSFFCVKDDTECTDLLLELDDAIKRENSIIFNKTYPDYAGDMQFTIYSREPVDGDA